jgi:hypothetical protein
MQKTAVGVRGSLVSGQQTEIKGVPGMAQKKAAKKAPAKKGGKKK